MINELFILNCFYITPQDKFWNKCKGITVLIIYQTNEANKYILEENKIRYICIWAAIL